VEATRCHDHHEHTAPATDVVPVTEPLFTDAERVALAGFLAGYSGLTRHAYALDLRQYTA
jgi:integrase/recombinase XerD